jgi:hypothetical protein
MRSCYPVNFFSKLRGICRTCLSCFNTPRRNSIASQMQVVEDSQGASAQIVFASRMPDLLSDPAILSEGGDLKGDEILKVEEGVLLIKHQGTQTEMPETQTPETQTLGTQTDLQKLEITQVLEYPEQSPLPSNQIEEKVLKLKPEPEPELELELELEPELEPEQKIKLPQVSDLASQKQVINSHPNWEYGKFKVLSPLLSQEHSTSIGLQDSHHSLYEPCDSGMNESEKYLSSSSSSNQYYQSSGGSFYSGIKTNIFQNNKTMERTLDLLQNASTGALNGVSDFSSLMDSITQDLKQIIEDPLYSSKSISLDPHFSIPSPSSTITSPKVPRVLDVKVVISKQFIIC